MGRSPGRRERDRGRGGAGAGRSPRALARRCARGRAPALVLWGGAEPAYTRRAGEALARGIPGAARAVVTGANHLGLLTNARSFNEAIEAWLDR